MIEYFSNLKSNLKNAGIAQPVEQLIRNQQVRGSNPLISSISSLRARGLLFCVRFNIRGRLGRGFLWIFVRLRFSEVFFIGVCPIKS